MLFIWIIKLFFFTPTSAYSYIWLSSLIPLSLFLVLIIAVTSPTFPPPHKAPPLPRQPSPPHKAPPPHKDPPLPRQPSAYLKRPLPYLRRRQCTHVERRTTTPGRAGNSTFNPSVYPDNRRQGTMHRAHVQL